MPLGNPYPYFVCLFFISGILCAGCSHLSIVRKSERELPNTWIDQLRTEGSSATGAKLSHQPSSRAYYAHLVSATRNCQQGGLAGATRLANQFWHLPEDRTGLGYRNAALSSRHHSDLIDERLMAMWKWCEHDFKDRTEMAMPCYDKLDKQFNESIKLNCNTVINQIWPMIGTIYLERFYNSLVLCY